MKSSGSPAIDIRRADTRFYTKIDWLESWHSFSFAEHYDPDNVRHGLLLVSNEDIVQPSSGFGMHAHKNMEIVTWILEGELEHRDSMGSRHVIRRGIAQRMSAGRGVRHSEMNPSPDTAVHLVQMWVLPDTEELKPEYGEADLSRELEKGGLILMASGKNSAAPLQIHQKDAELYCARLNPGEKVNVPSAKHVHLFTVSGSFAMGNNEVVNTSDAVRITNGNNIEFTAKTDATEVLIWCTS